MSARLRFLLATVAIGFGGAVLAGCAGGPSLPNLGGAATGTAPGHPAEIYMRIAHGALACWFGPTGRLTATHLFHADADPPASGGRVEIIVHERATQPKPWGLKAFRVGLREASGQTEIEVENIRMPEAAAQDMRAEVFAWARDQESCRRPAEMPPTTSALPRTPAAPARK